MNCRKIPDNQKGRRPGFIPAWGAFPPEPNPCVQLGEIADNVDFAEIINCPFPLKGAIISHADALVLAL